MRRVISGIVGAALLATGAWAALVATPIFPQTPIVAVALLSSSTASGAPGPGTSGAPIIVADCTTATPTTVNLAGASVGQGYNCTAAGARIVSLGIINSDQSATLRNVNCAVIKNSVNYIFALQSLVAATATANRTVNVLSTVVGLPIDYSTNRYIYLTTADKIGCWANAVTNNTTQIITVIAHGVTF